MSLRKYDLSAFIEGRLSWELSELDDVNVGGIASELACDLKNNGYCSEPYAEFKRALNCRINKIREKYCECTHCESYEFCTLLRKEGYII